MRGRTDQVTILSHESSFLHYPSCHVPSLLQIIPVRENEIRRSPLTGAIVDVDVRREREGHVERDEDKLERGTNHADVEDS
jgi:hypothetical protein